MEGKKLTLGELFQREKARRMAQIAAEESDPEVQARRREHDAYEQRMREAEERFARGNVATPFGNGRAAAESGAPREVPDDMDDSESDQWLEGYDSLGSDTD